MTLVAPWLAAFLGVPDVCFNWHLIKEGWSTALAKGSSWGQEGLSRQGCPVGQGLTVGAGLTPALPQPQPAKQMLFSAKHTLGCCSCSPQWEAMLGRRYSRYFSWQEVQVFVGDRGIFCIKASLEQLGQSQDQADGNLACSILSSRGTWQECPAASTAERNGFVRAIARAVPSADPGSSGSAQIFSWMLIRSSAPWPAAASEQQQHSSSSVEKLLFVNICQPVPAQSIHWCDLCQNQFGE